MYLMFCTLIWLQTSNASIKFFKDLPKNASIDIYAMASC
jgi:hypothetical protein